MTPYLGLQGELQRMRDACDNLKQANLRGDLEALKASLAGSNRQPPRPILKRQSRLGEEAAAADLHHHQQQPQQPQNSLHYRSKHLGQGYYSLDRPRARPTMYRHYKPRRLLPQPQPRRFPTPQDQD